MEDQKCPPCMVDVSFFPPLFFSFSFFLFLDKIGRYEEKSDDDGGYIA